MEEQVQKRGPKVRIASIHSSFNIYRNIHEAHDGPVTVAEQLKAIGRFIRWHQRQVTVGEALFKELERQSLADAEVTDDVTTSA